MDSFEMNNVIDVQVFVRFNEDGTTNESMKVNLFGTNYARMKKQEKQIESILDQSIYNGVHFTYLDRGEIGIGIGRSWIKREFTFTIND